MRDSWLVLISSVIQHLHSLSLAQNSMRSFEIPWLRLLTHSRSYHSALMRASATLTHALRNRTAFHSNALRSLLLPRQLVRSRLHCRSMSSAADSTQLAAAAAASSTTADKAANGTAVAQSDAHRSKADGVAAATLKEGSVTRFLSQQYPLPFPPLHQSLSFEDTHTWPEDPMRVFSQWYADSEAAYNKLSPARMDAPVHWPNTMQIATVSSTGFPAVRTVLLKGFDARGLIFFTNYEGGKGSAIAADSRVAVNFYWKTLERQVRFEGIAERLPEGESDAYFHERPIQSQIGGTVSPQSRPVANHAQLETAYVTTVQGIAQQVQQHLEKGATSAAGDGGAEELEATKQRVTELLSAMSLKANNRNQSGSSVSPKNDNDGGSSNGAASAEAVHGAHAASLSSLEKLDASPATRSVLHSLVRRPSYWGGFLIRPLQAEFWCDGAYRLHSRILYTSKDKQEEAQQKKVKAKTTAETQWNKTFLAP